jgi:thiamine-phosphate pyrophosphorylase
MRESYTAGAWRALERARIQTLRRNAAAVEPIDVLAALVDEAESRAAALLVEFGLDPLRLRAILGLGPAAADPDEDEDSGVGKSVDSLPPPLAVSTREALHHATAQARSLDRSRTVGTEDLLAGVLATPGPAAELLAEAGLDLAALADRLAGTIRAESALLPVPPEIPPLELKDPGEAVDLGRILDASANRASEGLRVVEDFVRFVLDDPALTRRIKEARHRLGAAVRALDLEGLAAARDTRGDVGTHIMTVSEQSRENPRAVLSANFKRTAEALRTLEEYGKLIDPWLAGRFEVLRYDVYTLEKLTLTAARSYRTLGAARLMVLVGGLPTLGDLTWIVGEALAGGADVIQLREKGLSDREWLRRAREVRILTAAAGARLIVNDRADLARLAGADGVHLGQEDVRLRDARRIVGTSSLIGVSTHDPEQLDEAVLDGASYLGVGPVFSSATKDFARLAGLNFVRHAAEATSLRWFAIGGIDLDNLDAVLDAGATRIAVASAVVAAERPRKAAAAFRARLDALAVKEES